MPDRDPTTLTFAFSVSADSHFDYQPTADWNYIHGDELVFESQSGPFAVVFDPVEGQHFAPTIKGPLEGNENLLVSDNGPATFRATGRILSTLTAEERSALFAAHGSIGHYAFKIAVNRNNGQGVLRDSSKNGGYSC